MNYIEINNASSGKSIKISFSDYGEGKPVVFIHDWPLSQEMWEYQINGLANRGMRCITYDRRGFGKSSKPWGKYDYDTLVDDLKTLLETLDLENVTLVGFGMGCGEVVRYFTRYKGLRVSKAVLISPVTPFLLNSEDNPEGLEKIVFDDMMSKIREDRISFLEHWCRQLFGITMVNHPVSIPLMEYTRMLASMASPIATQECLVSFSQTDFRNEMTNVSVPTLVIHGEDDRIIPIETGGDRSADSIIHCSYKAYEDAPHGLFYTHKERLNYDLYNFVMSSEIKALKEESFDESYIVD